VSTLLRPVTVADHAALLAWNAAHVDLLSPLDEDRLTVLLALADTAAVIGHDDTDVGFVLTFAAGSAYESANYRWFSRRHPAFAYLDRIVVDTTVRRTGLASRVYDELETAAAADGAVAFCLEVNVEPPNEPSLRFHRNRGYAEVGRQVANEHMVALFEKPLLALDK
jgi:uncharacterized protein